MAFLTSIPHVYATYNFICYDCLVNDFGRLNETLIGCQTLYDSNWYYGLKPLNTTCYYPPREKPSSLQGIEITDRNLTLLPNLVEQTPNMRGVVMELLNLSSIDTDVCTNICQWKNLQEIILRNNSLKTLPSRFLFNCEQLSILNLSKNAIAEIANNTFDNLSELGALDLSFNQIKALHENTFKPLTKLFELFLNGNQLQTIDPDLFFNNSGS